MKQKHIPPVLLFSALIFPPWAFIIEAQTDKPIRCVYLTNRKQRRADTMLVVRARESETEIELVLSPFIMEQK